MTKMQEDTSFRSKSNISVSPIGTRTHASGWCRSRICGSPALIRISPVKQQDVSITEGQHVRVTTRGLKKKYSKY